MLEDYHRQKIREGPYFAIDTRKGHYVIEEEGIFKHSWHTPIKEEKKELL